MDRSGGKLAWNETFLVANDGARLPRLGRPVGPRRQILALPCPRLQLRMICPDLPVRPSPRDMVRPMTQDQKPYLWDLNLIARQAFREIFSHFCREPGKI